jgi:hypothetical protein
MNVKHSVGFTAIFALVALLVYGTLLPIEAGAVHDPHPAQPEIRSSMQQDPSIESSLPAETGSGGYDPAVQRASDLFFIGRDLWSAATNSMVTPSAYGGTSSGGGAGWQVAGEPDRLLFLSRTPLWGFVNAVPRIATPGQSRRPDPTVDGSLLNPGSRGQTGIQPPGRLPGPFLNADLRRVIYLRDGDVWRAELDWATREFQNHRQVTRVGILNPARSGDISLIAWHENILLMRTRFSQERPILRVNLLSGEIEELEPMMVFIDGMFPNPSASLLCASHRELLACYDVSTGEAFRVSLPRQIGGVPTPVARRPGTREPPASFAWVDDRTFLVTAPRRETQHLLRVDLGRRSAHELIELPGSGMVVEVLPGGRHAAAWVQNGPAVRIALADGAADALPDEIGRGGAWLDESKYVHTRERGSISEIGVWLYDVARQDHRRICHLPAASRSALYFAEHGTVYLNVGETVLRTNLTAGNCKRIEGAEGGLAPLLRPPLDLRPGVTGDALWTSGPSAPQAGGQTGGAVAGAAPPAPAASGAEQPQGLERLLQATEGLPPELGEEVVQVYRRAQEWPALRDYFHPDCYALAFREWRQGNPHLHRSRFEREHERFAHCVDGARIARVSTSQVQRMFRDQYPEEQVNGIAACAGETMAEKFAAAPMPTTRNRSSLLAESIAVCRRPLAP